MDEPTEIFDDAAAADRLAQDARLWLADRFREQPNLLQPYADIRPWLEVAVSLKPEDVDLRVKLAETLCALKQDRGAMHHLAKALEAKPEMLEPRLALIELYRNNRHFGKAFDCAAEGIALHPEETRMWEQHALCCHNTARYEMAFASIDMAWKTATESLKNAPWFETRLAGILLATAGKARNAALPVHQSPSFS